VGSVAAHSNDLLWAIESLLEDGEIDSGTPAYAVARKAARQGYAVLTAVERALYDRFVGPALKRRSEPLRPKSSTAERRSAGRAVRHR
jgi:hypothetical protein